MKDRDEGVIDYLKFLSLCHTVTIDKNKNEYTAASPDEIAFVKFTKSCGMEFTGIDENGKVIIKETVSEDQIERHKYKLVGTCEFTSARKMSSNIYLDLDSGEYTIYTKGADSQILDVLHENHDKEFLEYTQRKCDQFSEHGLRTLFLATAKIDVEDFTEW